MPTLVLVILFGLAGGIAVGMQGPLASTITEKIGVLESIFIIHIGGAIFAAVPLLVLRTGGNLGHWRSVPWYALLAGGWGLVVIAAISYTFPRVGASGTVTLIVAGQLVISAALDHFGWLGVDVRHIDLQRVIGIAVLFVGVWLIVR
jgi:bacterial/archaeal transporter family-2 protein